MAWFFVRGDIQYEEKDVFPFEHPPWPQRGVIQRGVIPQAATICTLTILSFRAPALFAYDLYHLI